MTATATASQNKAAKSGAPVGTDPVAAFTSTDPVSGITTTDLTYTKDSGTSLRSDVKTLKATPKPLLKLLGDAMHSEDVGIEGLTDYIESLKADLNNAGEALARMLDPTNKGQRMHVPWTDPVTGSSDLNGPRIASSFLNGDKAILKAVANALK